MNRRTMIMVVAFGGLVVYGLVRSVIYPVWIEPALTIDKRIEKRTERLSELEDIDQRVQLARRQFMDFAHRTASMDAERIKSDLGGRLNTLIEKHKLQNMKLDPKRVVSLRKMDLKYTGFTVSADGPLESVIGFMRDVAELPHVLRMEKVKMSPIRSKRKGDVGKDLVRLTIPIHVQVLLQQRILGRKISDDQLKQPELFVRHEDRDYQPIWKSRPLWEYVPPVPLRVQAGRPLQVDVGKRAALSASASGGDKNYSYLWSPATRLKTPNQARTDVDTTEDFSENYTVTVKDGTGKTVTASVRVTVKPKTVVAKKAPERKGPLRVQASPAISVDVGKRASLTATISGGQKPYSTVWTPADHLGASTQPKTDVDTSRPFVQAYTVTVTDAKGETATATVGVEAKRARWKNRKYLQLRMALLRSAGELSLNELMVYNNKKKKEEYYAVGAEFDGGELVFVHPTGGLVRRRGGYFIYPIGGWVDQDIKTDDSLAGEHPWLMQAAREDADRRAVEEEEAKRKEEAAAKAKEDAAAKAKAEAAAKKAAETKRAETEPAKKKEAAKKVESQPAAPAATNKGRKAVKLPLFKKKNRVREKARKNESSKNSKPDGR